MTENNHTWYALRRTLPAWSFEDNLRELVECLPRYQVDEIIVKVDTEEFSHGQPPLVWVMEYQPKLFRIKQEMDKLGIAYSLNPWITQGHADRGRDDRRRLPSLQPMVGHDGAEARSCACPLSNAWRENTGKVWTLYAETKPHVMWVEDDIRAFNHSPVTYGCFCPLHMKRFSERMGNAVSREELVAAILAPGKPHPWRKEYLDMQSEIMIETVSFLAKAVHAVSPDTCMGLMSSGPGAHCLEGRRWHAFAEALADGRCLYSRPPTAVYSENSLRDNYYAHDSIKLTRHCLPAGVIEQSEVDNWTFSRYSKSVNFTLVQMAISYAYGCSGITLNLFDHCGTPMERTPEFGRMLCKNKSFLNALAAKAQTKGRFRGVRLLHHEKASYAKMLTENDPYGALSEDGYCCGEKLEVHGIPTVYDDEGVIATAGQTIAAFSDAEIRDFLKKGVFLDAVAAKILFDRGLGKLIGLKNISHPINIDELGELGAEEFFNEKFGGAEKKFLTMTICGAGGKRPSVSLIEPMEEIEDISRLVDPDARRHHISMYAFENELGGRVIVSCLDLATASGQSFNHPFRAEQLQAAVRWLARDAVPLIVEGDGAYPLAFRKDCEDFTLLGMFNLSLDPWPSVKFILPGDRDFTTVMILDRSGQWLAAGKDIEVTRANSRTTIEVFREIPFDKPFFLSLER
ncbi:MAG: hypothetical protein WCI51_14020 [Lentisphaerota bacterium]